MSEKFRSIRAFGQLQNPVPFTASSGDPATLPTALRVLTVLKKHPQGITRADLARELGVEARSLEAPLLELLNEGLVRVEPDEQDGEERLVYS